MFEQRGCIYCTKMHEDVFPNSEIHKILSEEYFVVQMNLFGDNEVIDFNGNVMSEKEIAKVWGVVFTPTLMFMPENIDTTKSASQNAIITMPGAFGKYTTKNLLNYVLEKGYESGEHFQKYHARKFAEQKK
jgi:thioredoxin-related protein